MRIEANYITYPVWSDKHFDFVNEVWRASYQKFDDMYELKPEYKKKKLEQEVKVLEDNVQSLTSIIGEQKKKLEDKKKELKDFK